MIHNLLLMICRILDRITAFDYDDDVYCLFDEEMYP